jgi:hypothetical protein
VAGGDGQGTPYGGAPARTRSWAERHAGKTAAALLVVPLAIRSALVSAGVSEDAADLAQIVVGGAALAFFTAIIVRARRRPDVT